MYEYKATILHIVDGDTVDVDIDLGFGLVLQDQRIRIYGIDAPESRTRDLEEKACGLAAKEFVEQWLPIGSVRVMKTYLDKDGDAIRGKFGRILADFIIDEETTLGALMVKERFAVSYFGASKSDIQAQHIINRQYLKEAKII